MQRFCFTLLIVVAASATHAFTTNLGQSFDTEPDAWTRTNDGNTSWYGWDNLEGGGLPTGPMGTYLLDDSTPDVGDPAGGAFKQSVASEAIWGHRSSSGNYYSGPFSGADDTITGVAPASGAGGYTTLVIQALGSFSTRGPSSLSTFEFMLDGGWTKTSDLYATNGIGAGVHWEEWTTPGGNLPYEITMTSADSGGIDALQIDTYWTPGSAPVLNARSTIPTPGACGLLLVALGSMGLSARRRSDS